MMGNRETDATRFLAAIVESSEDAVIGKAAAGKEAMRLMRSSFTRYSSTPWIAYMCMTSTATSWTQANSKPNLTVK
jgi:hypothetical protein